MQCTKNVADTSESPEHLQYAPRLYGHEQRSVGPQAAPGWLAKVSGANSRRTMEWDGRRGASRMGAMSAANRRRGGQGVVEDPRAVDGARRAGRVAMPRLPRRHVPGETVHVVGRCHNRDCGVTTPADCLLLIAPRAAGTDRVYR